MSAPTEVAANPWAEADEAKPRPKRHFGHCQSKAVYVVIQKGSRPVPYSEGYHRSEDRRTQVEISVAPLPGGQYTDPITRSMLINSDEWTKITLPSIHALNMKPVQTDGMYVQIELVEARKYPKKNQDGTPALDDQGRQIMASATVPRFVAVYLDESTCRAAQEELFGKRPAQEQYQAPATMNGGAPTANGMSDRDQATLISTLWQACQKDEAKLAQFLKITPALAHLTVDSPAVRSAMHF